MFESQSLSLYEMAKERKLLPSVDLRLLWDEHQKSGRPFSELFLDQGKRNEEWLLRESAEYLGWDYLPQPPTHIADEIIHQIDPHLARMYGVVPIRSNHTRLHVLAQDPFNSQIVDDLTFALRKDIQLVVTNPDVVDNLIRLYYGEDENSIEDLINEIGAGNLVAQSEDLSESDLEAMAGETPIIRFVNLVLGQAIKDKASDIHFEPFENEFKIRYRIDGALYEMAPPPKQLALPITSRIKVIAGLNIAERRVPQDGRIKITLGGRPVDLRVSTLPTQFGESVVLRVLDKSIVQLELGNLGMPDGVLSSVCEIIRRPNGIFIVTGPTGSGKTTTLYSALREVNQTNLKLVTAEDPVEYEIEGVMQVPINNHIGFSFAAALRSFLRQDPDVIMVGEIRDLETAQIAIQASLTGHLVLSTLHTNDASGAVTRLVDMGVEPFLIASSLEAVMAQRLIRRLCTECRRPYIPDRELLEQLALSSKDMAGKHFFSGDGCRVCNRTGYRNRMGIFELLRMSEALRELVCQRASTLALRHQALREGMESLRDSGLRAIFNGATSIEEVVRYT